MNTTLYVTLILTVAFAMTVAHIRYALACGPDRTPVEHEFESSTFTLHASPYIQKDQS